MCGCARLLRMSRSRANRWTSVARRMLNIGSFSATLRIRLPSTRSASQTSPMPPRPSRRSNRYPPTVSPGRNSDASGALPLTVNAGGPTMRSAVSCAERLASNSRNVGPSAASSPCRPASQVSRSASEGSNAWSSRTDRRRSASGPAFTTSARNDPLARGDRPGKTDAQQHGGFEQHRNVHGGGAPGPGRETSTGGCRSFPGRRPSPPAGTYVIAQTNRT
jgi:hypothetical protein